MSPPCPWIMILQGTKGGLVNQWQNLLHSIKHNHLSKGELGFAMSVVDSNKGTSVFSLVVTLFEIMSVLCDMQVFWIGSLDSRRTLVWAVYNESTFITIGRLIDGKKSEWSNPISIQKRVTYHLDWCLTTTNNGSNMSIFNNWRGSKFSSAVKNTSCQLFGSRIVATDMTW